MSDLRKAWRKRLAVTLRRFRRLRGHWPHASVIVAAKIGIEQVVSRGVVPPVEH